jgi:hypothetical protein
MDQNDHEETARADKLKDRTQRSRLAQQGRRAREKTNRLQTVAKRKGLKAAQLIRLYVDTGLSKEKR